MKLIVVAAVVVAVHAMPTDLERRDTSACLYYLPVGKYEFPHLIVPTNATDIIGGHSYFADVSPGDCATICNFDIPASRANQQCLVYSTFPRHDQLVTSGLSRTKRTLILKVVVLSNSSSTHITLAPPII